MESVQGRTRTRTIIFRTQTVMFQTELSITIGKIMKLNVFRSFFYVLCLIGEYDIVKGCVFFLEKKFIACAMI